jgi:hypothetical protein
VSGQLYIAAAVHPAPVHTGYEAGWVPEPVKFGMITLANLLRRGGKHQAPGFEHRMLTQLLPNLEPARIVMDSVLYHSVFLEFASAHSVLSAFILFVHIHLKRITLSVGLHPYVTWQKRCSVVLLCYIKKSQLSRILKIYL